MGGAGLERAAASPSARLRGRRRRSRLSSIAACEAAFSSSYIAGEVLARPGFGEAVGGVLLGRAGGAGGGADDEGDDGDQREGECAGDQATTPLNLGWHPAHRMKGNRAIPRMLLFSGDRSGLGHRRLHPRARPVGLPAGPDRRRDHPGRVRGGRLRRQPARAAGPLAGLGVALRAALRRARGAARRGADGGGGGEPRAGAAGEGDPPARPAPGRRRRRRGADRGGGAGARLGLRRRRPARAGDRAPAGRCPGLGDPAQPQPRAAALGPGPQRARPGRSGAFDRRPGDAGGARRTRRSPPTPRC